MAAPPGERQANVLLGLTVMSWAPLGLWHSQVPDHPVRLSIALFNLVVGSCLITRRPLTRRLQWRDILPALPSLALGGLAFSVSQPTWAWSPGLITVFVLAVLWTVWSLITLGPAFGVLPAHRGVITAGPYRALRHPAYAGETLMVLCCLWASAPRLPFLTAAMLCAWLTSMALRVRAEERVLSTDVVYQRYVEGVRWRLCPGVW